MGKCCKRYPSLNFGQHQVGGSSKAREQQLQLTSQLFLPRKLDIQMILTGGCSWMTLGITTEHNGEGDPIGLKDPYCLEPYESKPAP